MVDIVNLCGVDINEAMGDPYTANLLPYVAGLGPRKAQLLIKGINANGGVVASRDELVGDPERHKIPVLGPRVWNNCASFLYIEHDSTNPDSDPLDNTRIHPEDYDLARKVAADALGLDEEDVKAETDENGPGAIVRKLFKEEEQEKVNELILEEYAEQLEREYQQRKRATLEAIRAELMGPFEELRKNFNALPTDQIFTMFTGETRDSLCEGMIVPVNVRVVKDDFAIVKLDCGIEGRIESHEVSYRHSIKDMLQVGQTVQAKLTDINRKDCVCKLSMREEELRRPYRRHYDYGRGQWDYKLEDEDREELREKDKATGRTQRVIKHPLFKPFNSTQAEEYLGGQPAGEVVIRPSSKGNDHLTITWKVADGVYQHIDVLELQKDNEFSVGKVLRVGSKYTYTDLDELIVDHVKAMAKKVEELIQHEKFQKGSRADLGKSLRLFESALMLTAMCRKMVDHIHRCKPQPLYVRLLPRHQESRVLLPLLQGVSRFESQLMGGPGDTTRVRVVEESVSGYAGALQRLQAPVPERDVEDAIGRRAEEGLRYRIQSRGIILESCLFNRGELGWAGVHG
jgi:transcription elongation factor SPT6